MFDSVYHGKINKEETERLLEEYGHEGSFLTRDSESEPGAFCLCVRRASYVHTYRIYLSTGGWAIKTPPGVQTQCFKTLNELVNHYRETTHNSMPPLLYPLEKRILSEARVGKETVYMEL